MQTIGCSLVSLVVHLISIILISQGGLAGEIKVIEPISVKNGSDKIILDCPFELDPEDTKGLVIKWYYNNSPTAAYQWIPDEESPPQDLGILKGRLDTAHNVTRDESSKYRALAIKNPTTELSGLYRCSVSSFIHENSVEMNLIVYSPASDLYIEYLEEDNSITVLCSASGLFPKPSLNLYKRINDQQENILEKAEADIQLDEVEETFNITLSKEFTRDILSYKNDFSCELTIPQTDFSIQENFTYYPDGITTTTLPPPTTTDKPISTPSTLLLKFNEQNEDNPQNGAVLCGANLLIMTISLAISTLFSFNLLDTR